MSTSAILIAAVLGALAGLAADRLAARWPAHEGGRVRPADWRTAAVVLGGLLASAGLAARWAEPRDLAVLAVFSAALLVLLACDLDQRLLPDLLTLPLTGYAAILLVLGWNPLLAGKELGTPSAIAAAIGAPLLLLLSDRLLGGALGMGDVKLSVSLGLLAGLTLLVGGFLIASVLSAVVLLTLIGLRRLSLRSAIPFGPILIGGGVLAMLLPGA